MMLVIFLMLICTASLTLHETMNVAIHNRSPDIELASTVYFCNRGIYNAYSVEKTDTGAMMKIGFMFGLNKLSEGILIYEVQKKEMQDLIISLVLILYPLRLLKIHRK
jgi:hypothetical protein